MSTVGAPNVMGPLAGMFSPEAQAAIAAEEAADMLLQEQSAEQAIAVETSTAAAATATVEATSADALLGSVGLPAQQIPVTVRHLGAHDRPAISSHLPRACNQPNLVMVGRRR